MARVADIIDDALDTLAQETDDPTPRWPRESMLRYLNHAQREIASATKCFTRAVSLPGGVPVPGGGVVVPLPDDTVDVRWVMYDRKFIDPTSYKTLRQDHGDEFVTYTAEKPLYWYNDLTNSMELRLYPTPTTIDRRTIAQLPGNGMTTGTRGLVRYVGAEAGDTINVVDENGDAFANVSDRRGFLFRIESDTNTVEIAQVDTGERRRGSAPIDFSRFGWARGPAVDTRRGIPQFGFAEFLLVGISYIPTPYLDEGEEVLLPDNHEAALQWYMVHRALEKSTSRQDIDLSDRFFKKFAARVAQTQVEQSRGFTTRGRSARYRRI